MTLYLNKSSTKRIFLNFQATLKYTNYEKKNKFILYEKRHIQKKIVKTKF